MTIPQPRAREYLRVSEDRSGRLRSVDEQHGDHEADAEREGWALGAPYLEDGAASASRYARQARGGFEALLDDLRAGMFGADILVLWESSRGSRQVSEWVTLIERCERRSVRLWIHTHSRLYDPANPRDRRSLLEDAVDSEYETAKSRDRTLRAKRAGAAAGRPDGHVLFGYQREYERGKLVRQVEDPETAPLVREVAERFAQGETAYAIARDFQGRGIPTPRPSRHGWTLAQVTQLLRNPGYAGLRVHRGKVVGPADWPAIIPEELWRDIQARLCDPERRSVRDATVRHLLTGTALCGICEAGLRVQKQRARNGSKYDSYMCRNGWHVTIKAEWLEEFVAELTLSRIERADATGKLVPQHDPAAVEARAEATRLRERLDQARASAARSDGISYEALAIQERELGAAITAAEHRARPASTPAGVRRLLETGSPRAVWGREDFGIGLQREAVRWLLNLWVMPVGRGVKSFDPERLRWQWRQH